MPELPEVETIVRDLRQQNLEGQSIQKTSVYWDRTIATPSVSHFKKQIQNQTITEVRRRAKYIVLKLQTGASLLIHLRMTGRLNFFTSQEKRTKHDHVLLDLQDGRQLRFTDTRKFGRWYLLANEEEKFNSIGPEPLSSDFDRNWFKQELERRNRKIKPLLLDQSFIAGLGNIYVDEALFEAKIHPERSSQSLSATEVKNLYQAIPLVLKKGIDNLGTSLGQADTNYYSVGGRRGRNQDALKVFRRTGEKCFKCKSTIQRLIVGQRSSHVCLKCQR